ncbi:MAG: hypothetical protein ACI8SR_003243 [Oceanicoccus sp.]
MTNNYVLRRLRYTFNYTEHKMVAICALGGLEVAPALITTWLKKDDDPDYVRCSDHEMAQFLNGFIIEKRGKKDGAAPPAEFALNNNIIFRKLKIALNLIDQDILDLLESAEFLMGKAELTAFFRKADHKHYRECQDQILRNFLQGLQKKHTNDSTAQKQSEFQAIKGKHENKKESYKKNKGKPDTKPYLKPKTESEKVVYKNPKFKNDETTKEPKAKRPTISLNKDKAPSEKPKTVNNSIWETSSPKKSN